MIRFWKGKLPETVLITPVGAVFKRITARSSKVRHIGLSPWYPSAACSSGGREFAVINCGRGESAGDCVLFLKNEAVKEILFFGFAGSINPAFKQGELCSLAGYGGGAGFTQFIKERSALKIRSAVKATRQEKGLKEAYVYTIPSLFMEPALHAHIHSKGYDLIDMETAHIAAAGKGVKLRFIYYISDLFLAFRKINMDRIADICLKSV